MPGVVIAPGSSTVPAALATEARRTCTTSIGFGLILPSPLTALTALAAEVRLTPAAATELIVRVTLLKLFTLVTESRR